MTTYTSVYGHFRPAVKSRSSPRHPTRSLFFVLRDEESKNLWSKASKNVQMRTQSMFSHNKKHVEIFQRSSDRPNSKCPMNSEMTHWLILWNSSYKRIFGEIFLFLGWWFLREKFFVRMIVNSTNDGLLKLDWKRALRKIYLKKKRFEKTHWPEAVKMSIFIGQPIIRTFIILERSIIRTVRPYRTDPSKMTSKNAEGPWRPI